MRTIITMLVLSIGSQSGWAQTTPLETYRQNAMEFRLDGFEGAVLYQGGTEVELGIFGSEYETVFAGSPDAIESASRYNTMQGVGWSVWAIGVAGLVAEIVVLLVAEDVLVDEFTGDVTGLFTAWTLASTVVGVAGGIVLQVSSTHLSDAVQAYNRDLFDELDGAPQQTSIGLSLTGRF